MQYLKNNLIPIACLVLLAFLLWERTKQTTPLQPSVTTSSDTTIIEKKNTYITQPTLVKSIPEKTKDTVYLPANNYEQLLAQYNKVIEQLLAKNIYSDTIKIDSTGYAYLSDTVYANKLTGRKFTYNLKYPIITNTTTIIPPPSRQVYIGVGLEGNRQNLIDQFSLRTLYKDRRDRVFGASVGMNVQGQVNYGIQSFWKIKF